MAIVITTASAQAMLDALIARLNQSGAGHLRFYTGSAVALNSYVANCAFNATAFAATNTSRRAIMKTVSPVTDGTTQKAGTVGMWRARSGNGDTAAANHFKGTATNTGGGGDITFTSTAIGAGESVTVTSLILTMPITPA